MREKTPPYETLTFYLVAACATLLDQLVKLGVVMAIGLGNSRPFIDGFMNLTYVQNRGAAFSMFWGHADKLGLISLVVALGIMVYQWRSRPKELLVVLAMGLYLGGAIGNGIDRLYLGYVRDMFDLQFQGRNIFPIFNVADMAVDIGAALFVLHSLLSSKRSPVSEAST